MNNLIKISISTLLFFLIHFENIYPQSNAEDEIHFVFMTDIHIQPERNAIAGFEKAIEKINNLNPDFVITGGDLLFDVLAVGYQRADSLFNLYKNMINKIKAPVYNTIGNHDIWGWYEKSYVPRNHKEFGKILYQNRLGKTFYSFNHKQIKFFILDSIEEIHEKGKYYGYINDEQIEWLKEELNKIDTSTFIIISTHIPFITTFSQIRGGSMKANERGLIVENAKEVLDLFNKHNLKLVLQGHLHYYEELNVMNKIKFITGGAVSGRWWLGNNNGLEEGFVSIRIKGEKITSEYIEFGWHVN